jgi:hypothetical protein
VSSGPLDGCGCNSDNPQAEPPRRAKPSRSYESICLPRASPYSSDLVESLYGVLTADTPAVPEEIGGAVEAGEAPTAELTVAAGRAVNTVGPGSGLICGTHVRSAFEAEVNALGNANLTTEQPYLNRYSPDERPIRPSRMEENHRTGRSTTVPPLARRLEPCRLADNRWASENSGPQAYISTHVCC